MAASNGLNLARCERGRSIDLKVCLETGAARKVELVGLQGEKLLGNRWLGFGAVAVSVGLCGSAAGFAANPAAAKPVAWQAKWIAAAGMTEQTAVMPVFRREFVVRARVRRATLRASALGQGEVHLNGVKVGEDELTPGWTDFRKTVRYESYDVTAMLQPGGNVLGVMVGNGMFNVVRTPHRFTKFEGSFGVPEVLLQLNLEYADGSRDVIASDGSWE
jgi:hypothetical protein